MTNAQYFWMRHRQVMNAYAVSNLHGQVGVGLGKPTKVDPETEAPVVPASTQEELRIAFEDAEPGSVVKMQAPITLDGGSESIIIDKDLTLDLNGQTIGATDLAGNTSDTVFAVARGGELTVNGNGLVDGSEVGTVYAAVKLTVKGEDADGETAKLVINDGEYKGTYYAVTGNGSRQNTDVTINGGKFEGTTVNDSTAIFHPQRGILTINGGEFIGAMAIYQKSGKVVINDGTFTATGVSESFRHSTNGFNNTGDCFVVEACDYPGSLPEVEINGGTFISENAKPIASYAQSGFEPITKFVKGGKFNKKLDDDLVADGYTQVQDGSFWKVVKA